MRCAAVVLGTIVALVATSARAADVVRARVPTVLLVLTPPGRDLSAREADFLGAAAMATRARTDLALVSAADAGVDPAGLRRCGATRRMTCWAISVAAADKGEGREAPRYALIVVGHPVTGQSDRLYTLLLDVRSAVQIYRSASRADPEWRERVEDRIFRRTPQSVPVVIETSRADRLAEYFNAVVRRDLRGTLTREGRWWPSGTLAVRGAPPGLAIEIDRQSVGSTEDSATEVGPVRAGLREVVVRGPGAYEVLETVRIPMGGEGSVQWSPPPPGVHPARHAARWGGIGVIVAGAVVAGIGFAQTGDVNRTCIVRSGDADCTGLGGVTFGFDADQAPTTNPDDINPGGVQVASLGLALVTTGATWSAGGWYEGSKEDPPWWTWLVGLAVGGATYGIAAAAQGGS